VRALSLSLSRSLALSLSLSLALPRSLSLRGTVESLLDSASYGARWVLLSPAPAAAAGVVAGSRARHPDPNFQFGRWLFTVRARQFGPDGCGPVTATGNRDGKEILSSSMSGPMSERAPDLKVEAEGRAESTTVLV
jgi:hypothetical protein